MLVVYCAMSELKRRVNLYLEPDLVDRAHAALASLPGLSLSRVVNDVLAEAVPALEAVAEGVRTGNPEAVQQAFALAIGNAMLRNLGDGGDGSG